MWVSAAGGGRNGCHESQELHFWYICTCSWTCSKNGCMPTLWFVECVFVLMQKCRDINIQFSTFLTFALHAFSLCTMSNESFKRQIFMLKNIQNAQSESVFSASFTYKSDFITGFVDSGLGKKILDGFSSRTTGDTFKIFFDQISLN